MRARSEETPEITGKCLKQAAERGWKVPDEIRTDALCQIAELLKSPGLTPRDLASILRTLVAFDRADMLDEKLTLDRAKWAAGRPQETVATAADLARQLLDAARGHEELGPSRTPELTPGAGQESPRASEVPPQRRHEAS